MYISSDAPATPCPARSCYLAIYACNKWGFGTFGRRGVIDPMRTPYDHILIYFWSGVRWIGKVVQRPKLSQYALVKRIHVERKHKQL
jgi:hypothetical protein